MNKKYTTLSKKELKLLENLIKQYGNVVDFAMIRKELNTSNKQIVKNLTSSLIKKGWLVRIKKGTFFISDISGRGLIDFNQLTIAQLLIKDSYVSFEAALQYYGLFDQYLSTIYSISDTKKSKKEFKDWKYVFCKTKKGQYGNFKEFNMDGYLIKIASKEKAIIDFLVYRRTANNIDLVLEKLKEHKDDFDFNSMVDLASNSSIVVKRSLGFLFDLIGIDSSELYKQIEKRRDYSLLCSKKELFNAKWRIYIDKYFEKYVK